MRDDLSTKIVTRIRENDIAPTPKWRFIAKEYSIWLLGALLIIVGSVAFSVVLYLMVNNDWGVHEAITDSFLGFVILSLPYFWLVLLVLFSMAAEYNLRHTKKGYKYTLLEIVLGILIVTVVVGTIFYHMGLARTIDTILVERVPNYYGPVIGNRHLRWQHPDQGRLAGIILRVDDDAIFLQDREGIIWEVPIADARIAPGTQIFPDSIVKVIGYKEDTFVFRAAFILAGDTGPGMLRLRNAAPYPVHDVLR